jgi:hypothetical protein
MRSLPSCLRICAALCVAVCVALAMLSGFLKVDSSDVRGSAMTSAGDNVPSKSPTENNGSNSSINNTSIDSSSIASNTTRRRRVDYSDVNGTLLAKFPNFTTVCRSFPVPPTINAYPNRTRWFTDRRPRIAVLSISAVTNQSHSFKPETFKQLHFYSFVNKMQYCQRRNYDLILEDERIMRGYDHLAPAFGKIIALLKWLPHYDVIAWVDQDALFLDMSAKIESLVANAGAGVDMLLTMQPSTDALDRGQPRLNMEINTGVLFVRRSPWAFDFLRRVLAVRPNETDLMYWEQSAITYLLGTTAVTWRQQRDRNKNEEGVRRDRMHCALLNREGLMGWNRYLFQSLARFDRARGWPTARYWAFREGRSSGGVGPNASSSSSSARDVVLHFVACRRMPWCMTWLEYYFRRATCRNRMWRFPCGFSSRAADASGGNTTTSLALRRDCRYRLQPPSTFYPA